MHQNQKYNSYIMQIDIQNELKKIESLYGKQDIVFLKKKNELLEKEKLTLKSQNSALKKQLQIYKQSSFSKSGSGQILQLQHTRIVQLQGEVQQLKQKYQKSLSINNSFKETEYANKYRQLEKKYYELKTASEKSIYELKEKLMRYTAKEVLENKNKVTLQPFETESKGTMFKYKKIGDL